MRDYNDVYYDLHGLRCLDIEKNFAQEVWGLLESCEQISQLEQNLWRIIEVGADGGLLLKVRASAVNVLHVVADSSLMTNYDGDCKKDAAT